MKYPGLLLLLLCFYVRGKAQQASTVSASTTVTVISPVGISFDNVRNVNKPARTAHQFAQYKTPSRSLPQIHIMANDTVYDITIKEEEIVKDEISLYRLTVHFN
jgi:hypothetical protein